MVTKDEHKTQEEVPYVHPLDFSPFAPHNHQDAVGDEELEFCSDQADWNANSHIIDWNNPTPEHTEPTFGAHYHDLPAFDEVAAPPSEVHKTSAYDTRSVVPTHASYALPTTFQAMTVMQQEARASSIVPILKDGEQSHGVHPKNNIIVTKEKSSKHDNSMSQYCEPDIDSVIDCGIPWSL